MLNQILYLLEHYPKTLSILPNKKRHLWKVGGFNDHNIQNEDNCSCLIIVVPNFRNSDRRTSVSFVGGGSCY